MPRSRWLLRSFYDYFSGREEVLRTLYLGATREMQRRVAAGVGPMLEDERLGRAIENLLGGLMRSGRIPVFEPGLVGLMVVGGMTEALVAHLSTPRAERVSSAELVAEMARVIGRMASG